jgi:hypothetical protein
MMGTETVPETLDFNELTRLLGREEFINFSRRESFTSYTKNRHNRFSIHDGTSLHSKSQYTIVKHSRQLSEHTYTSDPHGLRTLIPTEFFQQDLL